MSLRRLLPPSFVLILVLSACAGGATNPSGSDGPDPSTGAPGSGSGGDGDGIEHPTGADEAILVIDSEGGFVPVEFMATRLPSFVLLGDGRVIMQGVQTLEFPGPLLPPLIERRLTEAGIQEILSAVEDTNLFTADAEYRGAAGVVADAADTVFHVNAGGIRSTIKVYALGLLSPDMGEMPGITPGEVEAHRQLQALNDALMLLDDNLDPGGFADDGWQPYQPAGFRLYVRDVTDQPIDGGEVPEQIREWPIDGDPAAFGDEQPLFGDGTRCAVVTGADAEAWLAELSAATQMTRWTDDGERRFSIAARPLLPHDEAICPELGGGA